MKHENNDFDAGLIVKLEIEKPPDFLGLSTEMIEIISKNI